MQNSYRQERIAVAIGDLNNGGAQKQSEYIAHALLDMSKVVDIYYTNMTDVGEPRFARLRERGANIVAFGEQGGILPRMLTLINHLRRNRPAVTFALRTYMNLYAGLACRALWIPCVGSIRSSLVYEKADLGRLLYFACKLPNTMLVNSHNAQSELAESGWVQPKRIHVVENVIDIDDFDNRAQVPVMDVEKHAIDVYFVGRLTQAKRLDWLLPAFKKAHQQNSQLHLTLVGDGEHTELAQNLIHELELGDAVTMLGYRTDAAALLAQYADMLMLTSEQEGFPNVLIEAMLARIPCVTTPAGDAPKIVEDGVTGVVVPRADTDAIADGILKLATDADRRRQMGAAGRTKVEQHFSYPSLHNRIETLLRAMTP